MIYAIRTISYIPLIMVSLWMLQEIKVWKPIRATHFTHLAKAVLIYSVMQIIAVFLEVWLP